MPGILFYNKVSCPSGIIFNHQCLLDCATGVVSTENIQDCVAATCPPGLSNTTDNVVCMKAYTTKTGSCPQDTTEWVAGRCYPDCEAPLAEGGTTCIKPTTPRPTEQPRCSWGYVYEMGCKIQVWFIWVITLFFVVLPLIALIVMMQRRRYFS